jgi:hypothetical protein
MQLDCLLERGRHQAANMVFKRKRGWFRVNQLQSPLSRETVDRIQAIPEENKGPI